jgi:hypothetical protein
MNDMPDEIEIANHKVLTKVYVVPSQSVGLYVDTNLTNEPSVREPEYKSLDENKTHWKINLDKNRFYLRGTTLLGLVNTVLACLFNIVIVKHYKDDGTIVKFTIERGTDFPPKKEIK